MQESKAKKAVRTKLILNGLSEAYPDAAPQLEFTTPFELLIATMLSAQCTDKQVNKCTRVLFEEYSTAQQLAQLTEDELLPYIKSCGFYRTKGKNIIETSRRLVERFDGEVPQDRDMLMQLPGVGRKTANVVVSNAFGQAAIAVDTHVFRVANRLGLAEAKDVLNTEKQLMECIPEHQWSIAHHWLIFHGRRVCAARNPKCDICTVSEYCKENIERKEHT
ncbi:MAG: endonuclease III [Clostridia bacterium]